MAALQEAGDYEQDDLLAAYDGTDAAAVAGKDEKDWLDKQTE